MHYCSFKLNIKMQLLVIVLNCIRKRRYFTDIVTLTMFVSFTHAIADLFTKSLLFWLSNERARKQGHASTKHANAEFSLPCFLLVGSGIPETVGNSSVLECRLADAGNYTFGNIPLGDTQTPCFTDSNIKAPASCQLATYTSNFCPGQCRHSGEYTYKKHSLVDLSPRGVES